MKIFIYILIDPRKPQTARYVGQTATPHSRHIQHCCESGKSTKCQWLELLAREGVMPSMVIVEETNETEADAKEKLWIARFSLENAGQLSNSAAQPQKEKASVKAAPVLAPAPAPASKKRTLETLGDVERDILNEAIRDAGGSREAAAKTLGISLATLYRKLPPLKKTKLPIQKDLL